MPIDPAATGTAGKRDDDDDNRGRSRGGPSDEGRGVVRRQMDRSRGKDALARAEEVAAGLADELRDMRDQRRELRAELAKFTAPGVVVLTPDDAKEWAGYVALGKAADVAKKLETVGTLEQKVVEQDRRTAAGTAAKALGWNGEALASMLVDKRLNVSFVDGQDAQGKAIKIPHVRPEGADDKTPAVALKDWQANNAAYLTPSLTAQPDARATAAAGNAPAGTRASGTQMVDQNSAAAGTAPGAGGGTARPAIPGRANYQTPGQRSAATK